MKKVLNEFLPDVYKSSMVFDEIKECIEDYVMALMISTVAVHAESSRKKLDVDHIRSAVVLLKRGDGHFKQN